MNLNRLNINSNKLNAFKLNLVIHQGLGQQNLAARIENQNVGGYFAADLFRFNGHNQFVVQIRNELERGEAQQWIRFVADGHHVDRLKLLVGGQHQICAFLFVLHLVVRLAGRFSW